MDAFEWGVHSVIIFITYDFAFQYTPHVSGDCESVATQ